jgi:hypothetical protein
MLAFNIYIYNSNNAVCDSRKLIAKTYEYWIFPVNINKCLITFSPINKKCYKGLKYEERTSSIYPDGTI